MYSNPYNQQMYMNDLQNIRDRIDRQMQQIQQPIQPNQNPNITQNFQLAPNQNNNSIKYAETVDDVKKELVFVDTLFINKGNTLLWLKTIDGNIRTFELNELVEKDDKDLKIEELERQIKEMKESAKYAYTNDDETNARQKPSNVSNAKSSNSK